MAGEVAFCLCSRLCR